MERKLQFKGKKLLAIYEILDSNNEWCETRAYINSQEELNDLINTENKYHKTFNIINVIEA